MWIFRICTQNPRKALIFHFHFDYRKHTHHTYMYLSHAYTSYHKPYAICWVPVKKSLCDTYMVRWAVRSHGPNPTYISRYYLNSLDRDPSQNFIYSAKTMNMTSLCIQISNTVVFFNYARIRLMKISKKKKKHHVNSKPKVLSNAMFRITRFRSTDKSDSVNY